MSLMLLRIKPVSLYSSNEDTLMMKLTRRARKIAIEP